MDFTILVEGLSFAEGPRWRDGYLYYSDFYRHVVERVDDRGRVEQVAAVSEQPSGLGWLPDGRLLIVSMLDRKLLVMGQDGGLEDYADLSGIATFNCNDMVVDAQGNAYVGNFGYDRTREEMKPARLALVRPTGQAVAVADDLYFPNGTVITPDGKTLIVAETRKCRLTAFDVLTDGTLGNRRLWADITPYFPDGICLNADGDVWVADPGEGAVVLVGEGGQIKQTLDPDKNAYACMLGGVDGRRLYVCTGTASGAEAARTRNSRIEFVDVDVPHAGLP